MQLIRTLRFTAALSLLAPGSWLVAQQQTGPLAAVPAKTGKAEISGVVVDSLHGQYLRGADVILQGAKANLVTDSVGRFTFDSLAPGTYQVGVFHPLLDTLGISLSSKPFRVGTDSVIFLVLSIPPAATIISRACPGPMSDQGSSAVIGHVNDPESLQPVAGAEVSVAWTDIEVSKNFGIRHTPHVLRDTTNAEGAFHLCGLPNSMDASLQARKARAVTSEIPISLGDAAPELVARTILLSSADSAATTGSARVSGRVVLEGSATNAGSRVELVGTDVVALTNEKGEFTMTKLPSGSHVLLARHLGYGAETVPVDLSPSATQSVAIKLPKFVSVMDPVLIVARRTASLEKFGFNQRKKAGNGFFLGPDVIQRMHAVYLTDILRQVPSLRVEYNGANPTISSSRGVTTILGPRPCIRYFLDGMPWISNTPGDINTFVNGNEIVAAEVYQPSQVPGEYTRGDDCITIVLWTRFRIRELSDQ